VETLEISRKERVLSRIAFYCMVVGAMWATNRLIFDPDGIAEAHYDDHGVARPYYAVPVSELPLVLYDF